MLSPDAKNLLTILEKSHSIKKPSRIKKNELIEQIVRAENIASLFALGNHFYFLMNLAEMKIDYVSHSILDVLGITKENTSVEKLLALWHPSDLKKMSFKEDLIINFFYNHIPPIDMLHYKVSYLNRLKDANGNYKKILHQSTALAISDDHKVVYTFCIETDLTHLKIPMSDTITFLGINGRPSYYSDDMKTIKPLTKKSTNLSRREIEVLSQISKGKSSKMIANNLNISLHTVNTHKKNIMNKSNADNITELISLLIIEGVI